MTNKIY